MDRGGSCPLVYRRHDPTMSDHKQIGVCRNYSGAVKQQLVAETHEAGVSIALVARRHGINASVVFGWLRDPRFGGKAASVDFLPVATSTTPMALPTLEKRRDPLDLNVEFPGWVWIHCRVHPRRRDRGVRSPGSQNGRLF